jgi:hypothetical protein
MVYHLTIHTQYQVRPSKIPSSPGVPRGSVLGPVLFCVFINDSCDTTDYSRDLHFADVINTYRSIKSPTDCSLLRSDTDSVRDWCSAAHTVLSISKINGMQAFVVPSDVHKWSINPFTNPYPVYSHTPRYVTILLSYYKLCQFSVTRTDTVKELEAFLDSKFNFHIHVKCVFPVCVTFMGLVCSTNFPLYSLGCLYTYVHNILL